jgi:peptidoglycan/LPS O-acetylase OafA/YrhL
MNQTTPATKLSPLKILLNVVLAFFCFFALQLISAFLLMKIPRFEVYYGLANILISLFVGILIGVLSGKRKGLSVVSSFVVSSVFSLIALVMGLLISPKEFSFISLLVRLLILISASVSLSAVLNFSKNNRRGKRSDFRFLK